MTLQRRALLASLFMVLVIIVVGVPLVVNDQLRYDIALRTGAVPGKHAERITSSSEEALLIVIPVELDGPHSANPWAYHAQFIAFGRDDGAVLENLETGEGVVLPIRSVEFVSASDDGSVVLLRGPGVDGDDAVSLEVRPATMTVKSLGGEYATPEAPGEWDISIWEEISGQCNRPSPGRRFVACFRRAGAASYLAGDFQLNLQQWGDYEQVFPLYRGLGFIPLVGFAQSDTVVYLQNENGIVRIDIPPEILHRVPPGTPIVAAP